MDAVIGKKEWWMSAFDGHLNKQDSPDFPWIDTEGVSYSSRESYMGSLLGFCGCGCPEDALNYIYGAIKIMSRLTTEAAEDEWITASKELDDYFKSNGERYFVYYYLSENGFTEHGGSVPGWLTDKGKLIFDMIGEMKAEEPNDRPEHE